MFWRIKMTLKAKLEAELFVAMRAKDEIRKRTIRMAISNIKLAEIERKGILDDPAIMASLYKEIKNRKETIEDARKGNRDSIISENEAEIAILQEFLPKSLNTEELTILAKSIIQEQNATSLKDMGNVMKLMVEKVNGQAPNDAISKVIKDLLQNQ
jgi:uncharacterized protein YqeY